MAAGDVAGLVREHADDLVRRRRIGERADKDENAPTVGDEGVEGAVVEDHDLDVLRREPGGLQDRPRIVAQQFLDLGVANDAGHRPLGERDAARAGKLAEEKCSAREQRDGAAPYGPPLVGGAHFSRAARPASSSVPAHETWARVYQGSPTLAGHARGGRQQGQRGPDHEAMSGAVTRKSARNTAAKGRGIAMESNTETNGENE